MKVGFEPYDLLSKSLPTRLVDALDKLLLSSSLFCFGFWLVRDIFLASIPCLLLVHILDVEDDWRVQHTSTWKFCWSTIYIGAISWHSYIPFGFHSVTHLPVVSIKENHHAFFHSQPASNYCLVCTVVMLSNKAKKLAPSSNHHVLYSSVC